MRVAVNRRALETNRRIINTKLHHPPIIVKFDDGKKIELNSFTLDSDKTWRVVYSPDKPWIEDLDDGGQPISFNVWIESVD